MGESLKEIIQKHMDELRSTNDGWIPVEERLPEETRTYIVAALSGMKNAITLAIWKNESKRFYITGESENYKVVAWRHLPEPYWPGGRSANRQESIESKRMRETRRILPGYIRRVSVEHGTEKSKTQGAKRADSGKILQDLRKACVLL